MQMIKSDLILKYGELMKKIQLELEWPFTMPTQQQNIVLIRHGFSEFNLVDHSLFHSKKWDFFPPPEYKDEIRCNKQYLDA